LKLLSAQLAVLFAILASVLFLAAGTVAWAAGWAFLVLFVSFVVALSLWLLRHDPGLLAERMSGIGKPDQKDWDKAFLLLANVLFVAWLVVMPLDAVRFRWSHMPAWLQVAGAAVLVCSFSLFFLTFRANSFLSPAVRLQAERGQTVISSGPYRYV